MNLDLSRAGQMPVSQTEAEDAKPIYSAYIPVGILALIQVATVIWLDQQPGPANPNRVKCRAYNRDVPVRSGPGPGFIFSVRVIRSRSDPMLPVPFRSRSQNFSSPGNPVRVGYYVTQPVSGPSFIFFLGFASMFFAYN